MILLSWDYLLLELESGEFVPFSAEAICVELTGEEAVPFDEEFLQEATKAVFYYFRHELKRQSVTVAEFSEALEQVLNGFMTRQGRAPQRGRGVGAAEGDLCRLAAEAQQAELLFFPRLRRAVQAQLQAASPVLRFHGLRRCVKQLTGARRWSPRCQALRDRIVQYLRDCAATDRGGRDCALLVQ